VQDWPVLDITMSVSDAFLGVPGFLTEAEAEGPPFWQPR
jgi:hypothetical protein